MTVTTFTANEIGIDCNHLVHIEGISDCDYKTHSYMECVEKFDCDECDRYWLDAVHADFCDDGCDEEHLIMRVVTDILRNGHSVEYEKLEDRTFGKRESN